MLNLNSVQNNVYQRALQFSEEWLAPQADHRDHTHEFAEQNLKALGRAGLLGINISTEQGGLGAGVVAYACAVRTLAQGCAGTAVAMMVTNMVAEAIEKFGSDVQKKDWLSGICSGQWPAAGFCLSEPGSGSDAASMQATAVKEEDQYCLNGTKSWVTSGGYAGVYLVTAKTDRDAGSRGVSAFLIGADTPGFSVGTQEKKLGQRTSPTTQMVLEDCYVHESKLLATEGRGFNVMMNALDGGRVGVSAQAIGVCDAAITLMRNAYELNPNSELADLLSQSQAERDAAWLLCLRAATLKDKGKNLTREASMSKLYCTETVGRVCQRAVRGLGALGHQRSGQAERLMRDARVMRIYEGSSEIQRLVIARETLKKNAI
jgi:acyl-CoA dehydrogenase